MGTNQILGNIIVHLNLKITVHLMILIITLFLSFTASSVSNSVHYKRAITLIHENRWKCIYYFTVWLALTPVNLLYKSSRRGTVWPTTAQQAWSDPRARARSRRQEGTNSRRSSSRKWRLLSEKQNFYT